MPKDSLVQRETCVREEVLQSLRQRWLIPEARWMMLYLRNLREPVTWNSCSNRKLSEKRVFPAIDIVKSGTRREDLLLDSEEQEAVDIMRKAINGMRKDDAVENILNMFARTKNNREYINMVKKNRII